MTAHELVWDLLLANQLPHVVAGTQQGNFERDMPTDGIREEGDLMGLLVGSAAEKDGRSNAATRRTESGHVETGRILLEMVAGGPGDPGRLGSGT